MADGSESVLSRADYTLVTVEQAEAPADSDADGGGWYRYVIVQGTNRIRGYRQGTLQSVTVAVEELVANLNLRRIGKRGRVHLTMNGPGKSG